VEDIDYRAARGLDKTVMRAPKYQTINEAGEALVQKLHAQKPQSTAQVG